MKMRSISITLILALLLIAGAPAASHAMGVSIGATSWYAWWDFKSEESNNTMEPGSALLYGPMLALQFSENWSLSSVFLYGKFEPDNGPSYLKRYDSDSAINYALSRYFKIFAGLKFMGFGFSDGSHYGYGPAAGISFTLPLVENLFLTGNISGMYLWGTHKNSGSSSGTNSEYNYNEAGANANLSIAYLIASTSTTLMIGGRYQYFHSKYEDGGDSSQDHHFYGVTASAIYSFSI